MNAWEFVYEKSAFRKYIFVILRDAFKKNKVLKHNSKNLMSHHFQRRFAYLLIILTHK